MVVNYLNIKSVTIIPDKADSPLIVDPDAMLTVAIPAERLQAISGHNP